MFPQDRVLQPPQVRSLGVVIQTGLARENLYPRLSQAPPPPTPKFIKLNLKLSYSESPARLGQVLWAAGCKQCRPCTCAMQGSCHQQLEMPVSECVEREKQGLIVGLFICVIVVTKA